MFDLYPFLMTPLFDPRPWGRFDLSPIYSQHFQEKIGESWLTGDNCKVQNGPLAGKTLAELASRYGRDLAGAAPCESDRFPLLVKFLFPQEKLSVQVHPDDAAAREIGQPCGKTECWYVAHAETGAQIGLGLKAGVTRADFERSVHEKRAEELLNWITVHADDMIYVAGGTVHTLGPGSIMVETQQQSDTTFRLYDYGRGRELHLEHGLRAIKERPPSGKVRPLPFASLDGNGNRMRPLIASEYFSVQKFELSSQQHFAPLPGKSSAQILAATEGGARVITNQNDSVEFSKGDAVVIPAAIPQFSIQPVGAIQFLRSYVPGIATAPPETDISQAHPGLHEE
jgi:mannose-6-phosphate isomerase